MNSIKTSRYLYSHAFLEITVEMKLCAIHDQTFPFDFRYNHSQYAKMQAPNFDIFPCKPSLLDNLPVNRNSYSTAIAVKLGCNTVIFKSKINYNLARFHSLAGMQIYNFPSTFLEDLLT